MAKNPSLIYHLLIDGREEINFCVPQVPYSKFEIGSMTPSFMRRKIILQKKEMIEQWSMIRNIYIKEIINM